MKRLFSKAFVILTVLFLARTFIACCDCSQIKTYYFSYLEGRVQNLDNSGTSAVVTEGDSVSKKAYGIRLKFTIDRLLSCDGTGSGIFTQAQAMKCECLDERWLAKQEISSIVITTANDFDANHPAGSDVTELFKALENSHYLDIDEYVRTKVPADYAAPPEENADFFLLAIPAAEGEQSFTLGIFFTDGREMSVSTTPLTLY